MPYLKIENLVEFGEDGRAIITNNFFEKIDCSTAKHVFTDTEYTKRENIFGETPNTYQTYFLIKGFEIFDADLNWLATFVLWDKRYVLPDNVPDDVYIIHCDCNKTSLLDVVILPDKVNLWIYYTPKDVEGAVNPTVWLQNLVSPDCNVDKKRNLTGSIKDGGTTYKICDAIGMFNSSLEKGLESVGIDTTTKKSMKWRDMSTYHLIMDESPNDCFSYLLGDIRDFAKATIMKIEQVNIINEICHPGIEKFDIDNFSRSAGALVWSTYNNYLMLNEPALYKASLYLSDCSNDAGWANLKSITNALDKMPQGNFDNVKLLAKKIDGGYHKPGTSSKAGVNGFGMGNISNFPLIAKNTGLYGAMVQGGRCQNENPHENPYDNFIKFVYDPDNQSCYGSKLREYDYPVGIPTIYEYAKDDEVETLGKVLSKIEDELVPNLYQIIVSGELTFFQDFINSKLNVDTTSILKSIMNDYEKFEESNGWGADIEKAHINGDFVLLGNEIVNGIITSKVLETIRKVSTNGELKSWMNLKVKTVTYYPISLEVSKEKFIEIMSNPATRKGKYAEKGDLRPRTWCRLPLEDFIGKYIDKRKELKSLKNYYLKSLKTTDLKNDELVFFKKVSAKYKKDSNVQNEDWCLLENLFGCGEKHIHLNVELRSQIAVSANHYNLLQDGIKLFINTLYGDTAAPYFPIGNTVVANNITAAARVGVWQYKAILNAQSITDGGLCSNDTCLKWRENEQKKPGFEVLADRNKLVSHRSLKVEKLVDTDDYCIWGKENEEKFNTIVKKHIDDFWNKYDLSFDFQIECKPTNIGQFAVYFNASDYYVFDIKSFDYEQLRTIYFDKCDKEFGVIPETARETKSLELLNDYFTFEYKNWREVEENITMFENIDCEVVLRCRGAKDKKHPKIKFLKHLANPNKRELPHPYFEETNLLGFKDWKGKRNKKDDFQLPGDEIIHPSVHKPINYYMPKLTEESYAKSESAVNKAKRRYTKEVDTTGEYDYFGVANDIEEGKYKTNRPWDVQKKFTNKWKKIN